jgi:hypothetical protein
MDVLLLSGRSGGGTPHPSRARAAALARDLAREGHAVRWICPHGAHEPPPQAPDGVELRAVRSQPAGFHAVTHALSDAPTELALTESIRARLPDVVHVLAFGGVQSSVSLWIAEALGAPAVASVDAREVLCHRGTLLHASGAECTEWTSPARCHACCGVPFEGGLTPARARRARWLRVFGAWSPYPKPVDFQNRFDLVISGLLSAKLVLAADEAQRAMLEAAGIAPRQLLCTPTDAPAREMVEIYARAQASEAPVE